ncbi:MAG: uroporphyrinogen decarboxylase family protein [bacterium]
MTVKERVYRALRGEMVDRVPFTCYAGLFPENEREPLISNGDIGLVHRIPLYSTQTPNVKVKSEDYWVNGEHHVKYIYETPVGSVYETLRTGGGYGSSLRCEFLIKKPEDYKIVEFMVRDRINAPNYEGYVNAIKNAKDYEIIIGNVGYSPIQQMLVMYMGPEQFAIDYYENRDLFDSLYNVLTEKDRELYKISAESPSEFFIYGDNTTSDMIGLERFEKYAIPRYNEFAEMLHASGKRLGSHMDGNLQILKYAIAESGLDFIEAFTPSPMFDMTLEDALTTWKDKVMWINFTSNYHIESSEVIRDHVLDLLRQSYPGNRFIISITENVPDEHRKRSFEVIAKTLREHGSLPLKLN